MKKIIWIVLFLSGLHFYSCSKDTPAIFEVVGMSLASSNNTGAIPIDAGTDSVPKDAYVLKIILNEVLRKKSSGDPQDNGFRNDDQLTSMNIYSLTNFDGTHPAGTSLNTYFLTALGSRATIATFVSLGKIGAGKMDEYSYIDTWSTDQNLYLMSAPTLPGNYSFVLDLGFSDGRTMTDTVTVRLY